MNSITENRLKELITYNSETGLMFWKAPQKRVKIGDVIKCKDSKGYIVVRLDNKLYRVHRLAWLYVYGYMPTIIDHINRNTSDNRIVNLRECTQSENILNASLNRNNKTGFKGVSFDKRKGLYRACTSKNRKQIFLGYFKTAEEAHERYKKEYSIIGQRNG